MGRAVRTVLLAAAAVFAWTSLVAVHAPASEAAGAPLEVTWVGVVTRRDRASILERRFVVPAGISAIDIDFSFERRGEPTEFDLGVRAPGGSRGWSEDRTSHIHLDDTSASDGFVPGPIQPGAWVFEIGVATLPDAPTPYRATVRLTRRTVPATPMLKSDAGWYIGDLHAHSRHSDGSVSVDDVAAAAVANHLDFVAVTDHNTTSQWRDVDRVQRAEGRVLLLHGAEITTYEGHFNRIGARAPVDYRLAPQRPMRQLLTDAAADGAFVSINHPLLPLDDEWCAGCGWQHREPETFDGARGIEIVNGPREANTAAWDWWASLLNAGHRFVAVGGSDTHDPSSRSVGTPATVVYARPSPSAPSPRDWRVAECMSVPAA